MGQELQRYPVFKESIKRAETQFQIMGADWLYSTEVNKNPKESRINEASISQPCCTAIQIALVDLLQSWGIQPSVVCGHVSVFSTLHSKFLKSTIK